jgi:hypothetical protein
MTIMRIAFGCEARVGKDTACSYIMGMFPNIGVQLSFAAALYDILHYAQETCGFPKAKDRKFLQWIGTEWARAISPNVWTDIVKRKIEAIPIDTTIIVTDVRFPNEADMLRAMGFTLVKIHRDMDKRQDVPANTGHASEVAMANYQWDMVIENNGSLDDFHDKLRHEFGRHW